MITLNELRAAVEDGYKYIASRHDIKDVEIYASSNLLNVLRLCYATNVPSNALEEPKSMEKFGISVRVHFKDGKIGFAKEDSALSKEAVEHAYIKARKNAINDTDFKSLPLPMGKPKLKNYADKSIIKCEDKKFIDSAYATLEGAFSALEKKKFRENFNITGELNFIVERMAIKSTTGIDASDESTAALSTLTTILELGNDVAGLGFDSSTHLKALKTDKVGKTSAEKALASTKAEKVESGSYKAVLGRQAVMDMIHSRLSIGIDEIDQNASPYIGKLDRKVGSEMLTIWDDALFPKAMGTRAITDEGLPTTKTKIIEKGKLVNYISNDYYAKKYSKDKRFNARNGFRGGGRNYDSEPGVYGTNIVIEPGKFSDEQLVKEVKNGIYVGRIWYTYPVNGMTSSDFTCTVRGDSYIIKDGEIVSGLVPNTLRINDNLESIFHNLIGIGKKIEPVFAWGVDSIVICPEMAVKGLKVERIAKGLY